MRGNLLPIAAVGLVLVVVGVILLLPLGDQKPPSSPDESTTEATPGIRVDGVGAEETISDSAIASDQPTASQYAEMPHDSTQAASGVASQPIEATGDEDIETSAISDEAQPGSLTIMVFDINGMVLPGARVRIAEGEVMSVNTRGEVYVEAPPDPPFEVEGSHTGYESHTRTVTHEDIANANLQIRLIPRNALTGRVIDNLDNAIQGAEVRATAETGIWVSNVRTDQRGVFTLNSPPQTAVRIQAVMEGYSDEGAGRTVVEPPQSQEIILRLEVPTLSISGRVISQEDGSGVEGVTISASQEGGIGGGEAVTGSDGGYRITNLPKGSYSVRGVEEANANYIFIPGEESKQVRLIEWDVNDVNFTVSDSYTVFGRVLLSDGRPVPGAAVSVERRIGVDSIGGRDGGDSVATMAIASLMRQGQGAVSGSDGGFVLGGVPLPSNEGGFYVRLTALHDEYGIGYSEPLPPSSNIHTYEVVITIDASAATIHGEVVTKQGGAVAEAQASITMTGQGVATRPSMAQTNFLGEFTLEGIPTLEGAVHLLSVEKDGYAAYSAQLRLQPGEIKRIEIVLDSAGEIGGRVTDQNGAQISGAQVTARSLRRSSGPVVTNEQGVFRFNNLADGVFDIIVNYPGNPPLSGALYQVTVGTLDANVILNRTHWIVSGPVWDAQRDVAIHRYSIGIEGQPSSPRGRPYFERRDFNTPDGHYTLTFTEPGEYRLRFFADGYEAQERRVRIEPEIPEFQYIGAGLEPIEGEGEIIGAFVANPGTELAAIQVIGLGAFPVQNNQIHLQGIPSGLHDLLFFIHEIGSGARYPLGVLPSVPVESNGRTELGALGPLNINAYIRDGVIAD